MTGPTQQPAPAAVGCDTSGMVMIHRVYRHLYREAPAIVRRVPDGAAARTAVVAEHVRDIAHALHHHHRTEDELLWDDLEARAPACALHVGLMRSQHAEVGRLLAELDAAVPAWEARAGAAERDAVADLLDRIGAALETHLGAEEQQILPVAARTMSQAEWDRLGEAGRSGTPRDKRLTQLGWILEALGPQDGQRFLREELPAPVRLLWTVVGRRQFEKHRRAVHGA